MAKFRNTSNDTVLDYVTQQVAEPDAVIEVEDDLAEHYEAHPYWEPVPDAGTRKRSTTKGADGADKTEEA